MVVTLTSIVAGIGLPNAYWTRGRMLENGIAEARFPTLGATYLHEISTLHHAMRQSYYPSDISPFPSSETHPLTLNRRYPAWKVAIYLPRGASEHSTAPSYLTSTSLAFPLFTSCFSLPSPPSSSTPLDQGLYSSKIYPLRTPTS